MVRSLLISNLCWLVQVEKQWACQGLRGSVLPCDTGVSFPEFAAVALEDFVSKFA